jgi:subtilisin family serine protease
MSMRNFTSKAPNQLDDVTDVVGHGTHCAGTIFGRDVDHVRIGIAPGVTSALVGKVLDDRGGGTTDALFRGLQWAVDEGANIISLSLAFDFPGMVASLERDGWPSELAVSRGLEAYRGSLRMFDTWMMFLRSREAEGRDALVVAATGNESRPKYRLAASLPAAAQGVVSVGALGSGARREVAVFSNSLPTVVAPGVDIVSAKCGGGLTTMSGTSMATPHVAGVAALWWQAQADKIGPNLRSTNVYSSLIAMARLDSLAETVSPADRGAGLVVAP